MPPANRSQHRASLFALLCGFLAATGCQVVSPRFEFRFPTGGAAPEAVVFFQADAAGPTHRQLKTVFAREARGLSTDELRNRLLGFPHRVQLTTAGEVWWYTFIRLPEGMLPEVDVRQIPAQAEQGDWPNIRVAVLFIDNVVSSIQSVWLATPPVSAGDVEALLGRPDRRETTTRGVTFLYRYACFTGGYLPEDLSQRYRLTEATVAIEVRADGSTAGFDLTLVDHMALALYPDGSTVDPASEQVWTLRPNLASRPGGDADADADAATTVTSATLDVLTFDLGGVTTPGEVHAAFGWARETVLPRTDGGGDGGEPQLAYSLFPIRREGSAPGHLVVAYRIAGAGNPDQVDHIGVQWNGGLLVSASNLLLRMGEPDSTTGSPTSGLERWFYDYELVCDPPVEGTSQALKYGVRIGFTIRNREELAPEVTLRRLTLNEPRRETATGSPTPALPPEPGGDAPPE